jgi:prepilin-type N-terminal cleavage/methylation domain-containing protein
MSRPLPHPVPARHAFSLIELLCVFAIIGVLVGLLLGPVGRALNKARRVKSEFEAPAHFERLNDGMRRFLARHQEYQCPDLDALLLFSNPGSPTERWLRSNRTTFKPFSHESPDDQLVLTVEIPQAPPKVVIVGLTKGELTRRPE